MKLKSIIHLLVFPVTLVFLVSCERDITFEFSDYKPKIIVDGSIYQGEYATVFLTRSSGFFDVIDTEKMKEIEYQGMFLQVPEYLYNMLVLDASVVISDGVVNDTLEITLDPAIFPFICYRGAILKGEAGKEYSLRIMVGEQVLESSTSIPQPVPIDSLWFTFRNQHNDSLGYIYGKFDDPVDPGNYYRILTKVSERDEAFVHPWNSVWRDKNFNGEEDVEFVIYHGSGSGEDPEDESRWYFRPGENVLVRLSTIDYHTYRFWYSFQQNAGGGGNPFASPAPIETNISGGLGLWAGYSVYDTLYTVTPADSSGVHPSPSFVVNL